MDTPRQKARANVRPVQYGNLAASPVAPFFATSAWWRRFLFRIVSARELATYIYLCSLFGPDSLCYPTQSQIAQELGFARLDTVAKALKKLTDYGLVIRNTQQLNGFQRTVFQKPAPEFSLIRLLDAKAIDTDLFPWEKDVDRFIDELDTTQGAIESGLTNLLGREAYNSYFRQRSTLRGLLATRFWTRSGISYEDAWASLNGAESATSAEKK